jgi:hypothetical protein
LAAEYVYDGATDGIRFESTIGYSNNVFENILFAFAVFGAYSRSEWEEPALGDARLDLYDGSYGIDTTFTAPYEQNHDRTIESYRLSIPMGLEWAFHKYGKLRIGVTLTASHIEDDRTSERGAVELTDDVEFLSSVFNSRELDVESSVDAVYLTGLEINVNDRLVVDLYSRYTYEITLLQYGYVSVRYKF